MKHGEKQRLQYTKDEFGKDILLKDGSLQVMMEWEKGYMEACIDALKPAGDVLEIGFGLGYSATHIQKYHPRSHTIIECDPTVIEKANEWAKSYSNIKIVRGYWQDELQSLGTFDAIFFDDYTPFGAGEVEELEEKTEQLQKMNEKIQLLLETGEDFLEGVLKKRKGEAKGGSATAQAIGKLAHIPVAASISDRLLHFFQTCLDHHMNAGAKMSSYIDFAQFKKRELEFQRLIASRIDVTYAMKTISVEVPPNCEYYAGHEALVLTICKK